MYNVLIACDHGHERYIQSGLRGLKTEFLFVGNMDDLDEIISKDTNSQNLIVLDLGWAHGYETVIQGHAKTVEARTAFTKANPVIMIHFNPDRANQNDHADKLGVIGYISQEESAHNTKRDDMASVLSLILQELTKTPKRVTAQRFEEARAKALTF